MKNTTILKDEQIADISQELDEFLLDIAKQYDLSALQITGLVMARLIRINELADLDNFYRLLRVIQERHYDEMLAEQITIQ
jgi:hypothetical protein